MIGKLTDTSSKLTDMVMVFIIITIIGGAVVVLALGIEAEAEKRIGKFSNTISEDASLAQNMAGQVIETTDSFYVVAYAISGPLMIAGIFVAIGGFIALVVDPRIKTARRS